VNHMEARLREALRMGFTRALIPAANLDSVSSMKGMKLIPLGHIRDALGHLS